MATKKKPTGGETPATENSGLDTGTRKPMETLEDVKNDINAETSDTKPKAKKRGPYKKKPKTPEPPPVEEIDIDDGSLAQTWKALSVIIASRIGGHWVIKDEEADQLAKPTKAVLDKYAPSLGRFGAEIGLGIAVVGVFFPRIMINIAIAKAAKEELAENSPPKAEK